MKEDDEKHGCSHQFASEAAYIGKLYIFDLYHNGRG